MSSSNARRIAPAPSQSVDDTPSFLRTTSNTSSGKSGIKRASTACQNCKNIKRKCDQQNPCSNCVKTGTECVFDQGQDGRRRAARKRNVEELELKRDALDTILESLRHSDDDHVQYLLGLIKNNAPLDEIIQYAAATDQYIPESQLASLAVAVDTGLARKNVLSINALIDTPSVRVPASPWTSVTSDDDFVSHLVSTFFTWFHPAYPCMIRDVFVADMIAGDPKSDFCCPVLVNAMLAMACQFSDHPGVFQKPGDPTSRGQQFLKEALTYWTSEAAYPKVTTLQAGQLIAVVLTLVGKDRLSTAYVDQLNDIATDVLFKANKGTDSSFVSAEMQKSLSLAVWSLYLLSVGYNLSFMRPRTYSVPVVERLSFEDEVFTTDTSWHPYPGGGSVTQTHFGKFANLQYDLHEIGADIASFIFDTKGVYHDLDKSIQNLDDRLNVLSQNLPWSDDGATLNPHIMDLNIVYHWLRIILFNFIKSPDSPVVASTTSNPTARYARQQCLTSARVIASLYQRYFSDFGFRSLTIWMPQTATTVAHMLIEDLDNPEVQDIFHDVCVVITSVARRWLVMRGHARMLLITAERQGQTIPERTRQVLSHIAIDSWRREDHKHFDASIYPNYTLAKRDGPRNAGMGDLLEQWADFNIQDLSPAKTPMSDVEK